jgi:hypothetical protein
VLLDFPGPSLIVPVAESLQPIAKKYEIQSGRPLFGVAQATIHVHRIADFVHPIIKG